MDSKLLRTIAMFGLLSVLAMTFLMMFSLNQVADTGTQQIAADIGEQFGRHLDASQDRVRVTMQRDGPGAAAARTYTVRLRPASAIAGDAKALQRLMFKVAYLCASELLEVKADITVHCVAELAGGATREAEFRRERNAPDGALIAPVVARAPAPPDGRDGAQR